MLSTVDWNRIFIPEGFAHGYCTLGPDTEVIYKVSGYYSPEHDWGLLWNDPALGAAWPVSADQTLMSDKDWTHPVLSCLPRHFSVSRREIPKARGR